MLGVKALLPSSNVEVSSYFIKSQIHPILWYTIIITSTEYPHCKPSSSADIVRFQELGYTFPGNGVLWQIAIFLRIIYANENPTNCNPLYLPCAITTTMVAVLYEIACSMATK